jgi:polyhydroxybutyrate depolymerase
MSRFLFSLMLLGFTLAAVCAADAPLKHHEIEVDGVKREALVYIPESASQKPSPVIFVFHGHGGTMKSSSEGFACHKHWPEAICVYMQGLATPTKRDPKGEKSGWQNSAGEQDDRDLKFFDAALEPLKKNFKVDEKRVYATGFSNGGGFTFVLWAKRGSVVAAVAPCGAFAGPKNSKDLTPKPCLHIAGQKDNIVPFEMQERSIEAVRKLNECDAEGKPWANAGMLTCTLYPSRIGNPVVWAVHPGGHAITDQAGGIIVRFFKENARK